MSRQVIPDNASDQLAFFTAHIEQWEQHAASIGVTPEQIQQVRAALELAQARQLAFHELRIAAHGAAMAWESAAKELRRIGGNAVRSIKTHAQETGDTQVFIDAHIDPPNRPGPKRRTPGEQSAAIPRIIMVSAIPTTTGTIQLRWRCPRAAQGTFYRIHRQLENERTPRIITAVGAPGAGKRSLEWEDAAVPTGQSRINYFITPCRGGVEGQPGPIATVQFGTPGARAAA